MRNPIKVKNAVVEVLKEYNANPPNVWEDGTIHDAIENNKLTPDAFTDIDTEQWVNALMFEQDVREQLSQLLTRVVTMLNDWEK